MYNNLYPWIKSKNKSYIILAMLMMGLLVMHPNLVQAAIPYLDTTFDNDGIVTHHNAAGGDGADHGRSVKIDGSGNILVAGDSISGGTYDMALWRYDSSGNLDTSFGGGDGIVTHNSAAGGNSSDHGYSVTLGGDGNIIVSGASWSASGDYDMTLWRYDSSGNLDTSFGGGDGIVTHNSAAGGNGYDNGHSVTVDGNGKILVTGYSLKAANNYDMALWRYDSSGNLDTSFGGGDGIATHNSAAGGNGFDNGHSVTLDASGNIIVAGLSTNASGNRDMALWRYDSSGNLDTSFGGGDGIVTHNSAAGGDGQDEGQSVSVDGNGNIIVTGFSLASGDVDMVLWRYDSNGNLDTSFGGGDGIVTHHSAAGGNAGDSGHSVTLDESGNIIVAGDSYNTSNTNDMTLWRYDSSGNLDTSFGGGDGIVTHNSAAGGNTNDLGQSVIIDGSGNILVTGWSRNAVPDADMALWRYGTDGTVPISTVTPPGGTYVTSQNVILSANETATIYYTTDGSTPTISSNVYSGIPINVSRSLTLKYFAVDTVGNAESVQSTIFTITGGQAWAWGWNDYGQLGDGTFNTDQGTPVQVHGENNVGYLADIVTISAGGEYAHPVSRGHNIALKADGTVWSWGNGYLGKLGNGLEDHSNTPVQVLGKDYVGYLTDMIDVTAGGRHSLAIKSDGTVWAWGENTDGQLGDGGIGDGMTPLQVLGEGGVGFLIDIVSIAAGDSHSVALKKEGTVWSWGDNSSGQLGHDAGGGHSGDGYVYQALGEGGAGFLTGVSAIAAGMDDTVALKSDGTVWAWGNSVGSSTPVQVLGEGGTGFLTDVSAIAAGMEHSVALKNDGTVWAWGNSIGSSTPVQVLGEGGVGVLSGIVSIAAGGEHSIALKDDGTLWAWGDNGDGQLGDGYANADPTVPVQVHGLNDAGFLTGAQAISGGWRHSVAIKTDTYPPSGTVLINNDTSFTNSSSVTLTISATDDSGSVASMQFSNFSTSGWSAFESYTGTKSWTLESGDGTKNVYVKFKDGAENVSNLFSDSIVLDTVVPTGSISIDGGVGFTNSTSVTLTLSGFDTNGVSQMMISNDGVFDTEVWEAYGASKSWTTLSGDGLKTVYVQFKDNAGNISTTYSDTITLDIVLPTTTVSLAGATYFLIQWVTLTTDEAATIYYTTDGSPPTTASYTYSSPILIDSSMTLQYFAKDSAGNEETVKTEVYTIESALIGGSVQSNNPLNLTSSNAVVMTLAGSPSISGSIDGTGTAARFYEPVGITTDGTNLFISDYKNHTIRKMDIASGTVDTVAGTAGLDGGTDGTGPSARFNYPRGITTDGTNLFETDYWGHTIRKIVISTGEVTTIAGSNGNSGSADGFGSSARFNNPNQIVTDGTSLFISDTSNHTIRKVEISTGAVSTIAGTAGVIGSTDGAGLAAKFNWPDGITTDGINLFVTESENHTIRKIVISTGLVTTLAGTAGLSGSTDGVGTLARFNSPRFITTDDINLFVSDMANNAIRKIVISTGEVTTIAGLAGNIGSTDGVGTSARFNGAYGMTTDGTNLYITDVFNHTIRKIYPDTISPTGTISINSGALFSNATTVILDINCDNGSGTDCAEMQFSNYSTSNWSTAEAYTTTKTWNLESIDGVKTVHVKLKDDAGNWSDYFTDTIVLDTMAPLASSITSPVNGFLTLDNTPTLTGTAEANSTVEIFDGVSSLGVTSANGSGSWSFTSGALSDAVHTFTAKATDAAGNTSLASAAVNITVDTTSPTGTISINSGAPYSTSSSVTLSLTCSDSNGCAQMKFSNAQAHGWSTPEPYSNTKTWTLSGGDASKTVYVWFGDSAGNGIVSIFEADSDTIILDTTLPITSASPTGGLYGSGQSVTLSTSADGTIYYTTDSSTPTISSTEYSGAINVASTSILKFFAMDNAGNQENVHTETYTIDTVAPSGSISINSGSTFANSTAVTLTLAASDIDSSVTEMQLSNDGNFDIEPWETYALTRSWLLTSGDGEKSVYVRYKDTVGNITSSYSDNIILSTFSAPDNPANLSGASNDDGSISVTWSAPAAAGISGYNIYRDDVKVNTNLIESTNYTDSDTANGTSYNYRVTSVGLTGKESSGATVSVTSAVDVAAAPSVPEGVKIEDPGTGDSLKVLWLANSENDLAGYKVHWGTAPSDYTYSFNVGNMTSYTINSLTEGTAYYIAVSAYDADLNESEKSAEHTENPELVAAQPDQPSNFIVTEGNEYLKLDWSAAAGVSGYMVYIGETDGLYGVPVRTMDSTYTFKNLRNGKSYYVAVASYDVEPGSRYTTSSVSDRIASSGTPYDNAPPMVPSNLSATDTGIGDSVILSWDREESFDIAGYVVAYKETGASIFEEIESVGITWNYAATGLTQDTSYSFFVYSYDKSGNFSEPNGTTATPTGSGSAVDLIPPDSPLLGALPDNQKLNLLITPPADSDVDYYNLYIYNLAAGKYMPIASTSALSYEHSSGVENGKALVFVATAVDTSGNESGYSDSISVIPSELAGDIELEKDPPVLDRVDGYDIIEIANGFGRSIGHPDFNPNADLNGDGIIDGEDVTVLAPNHGKKKEL